MDTKTLQDVIQALVLSTEHERGGQIPCPERPVLTISRDHGSGGDEIAAMLSKRLDVPLYDYDILHQIAALLNADPVAVKQIDESVGKGRALWLYRLFTGQDVSNDSYRRALIHVVLRLGRMGGVLVGRGGHEILADRCVLRIRICGSPGICAKRLAETSGLAEEESLKQVNAINSNRSRFVWEMFQSRLNDPHQFDITINTDRLTDFTPAIDMLVFMARAVQGGKLL